MRTWLALSAIVFMFASTSAIAAPPVATPPPFGAQATTGLRINAANAYLITFTVLRDMVHAQSRLQLISSVYRCADSCDQVADQVEPLPASALKVASNGTSATLRTRWAGVPLVITWKAQGQHLAGEVLVVNDATTQHQQIYQGGVLNATTVVSLFGRACKAYDGLLYKSDRGVADDYPAGGKTTTPHVDSIRNGLSATRGRCLNQQ